MRQGRFRSYFLYFGGRYVRVILLYFQFGVLDEVRLAFMIFRQSVSVAVGAVAPLTEESQETHFFVAGKALGVVGLFARRQFRDLGHLKLLDFHLYSLGLLLLSISTQRYLKHFEHIFILSGLP
jgi:hypothetical protein